MWSRREAFHLQLLQNEKKEARSEQRDQRLFICASSESVRQCSPKHAHPNPGEQRQCELTEPYLTRVRLHHHDGRLWDALASHATDASQKRAFPRLIVMPHRSGVRDEIFLLWFGVGRDSGLVTMVGVISFGGTMLHTPDHHPNPTHPLLVGRSHMAMRTLSVFVCHYNNQIDWT